jgi:hypothetical protein
MSTETDHKLTDEDWKQLKEMDCLMDVMRDHLMSKQVQQQLKQQFLQPQAD